jgi:hypothetical protein
MDLNGVIERAERVAAVRADQSAGRVEIEAALRALTQVRSWLAGAEADLSKQLAEHVTFPEKAIADCTRGSFTDAIKTTERADTLGAVAPFATALNAGAVTVGHVDAITKAAKPLEPEQRAQLLERVATLVDVAAVATVAEFGRRLAMEVKAIRRDDGMARLERQQRAARLRTWTDGEGMVCLSGRFDPLTGVRVVGRLEVAVDALFAEAVPATCPSDPIEKQQYLLALAFARIVDGDAPGIGRAGRPEFVAVIDTSQSDGAGGPQVDWGIPVEIPARVLADLTGHGDVHAVVVRNGVVLHAPGELNLGRTTRLANRAQRRALRSLYATCAIPGCAVRYDRCKLHHVVWWRNGGSTDLHNLLPVCAHHHTRLHNEGWELTLDAERHLTIRFPDGSVLSTGPPSRRAA